MNGFDRVNDIFWGYAIARVFFFLIVYYKTWKIIYIHNHFLSSVKELMVYLTTDFIFIVILIIAPLI